MILSDDVRSAPTFLRCDIGDGLTDAITPARTVGMKPSRGALGIGPRPRRDIDGELDQAPITFADQLGRKQPRGMQRGRGNPSQPADLTISDQSVRQGHRDEYEREHQDGWGPDVDDRKPGAADASWICLSDEPEHRQQDGWECQPAKKGKRLSQGELALEFEQFGELNARPVTNQPRTITSDG